MYDQVGLQLEAKTKVTKHSGFFVSAGELEVLPDPTAEVILDKPIRGRKEKGLGASSKEGTGTGGLTGKGRKRSAGDALKKGSQMSDEAAAGGVTTSETKLPVIKRKRMKKAEKEAEILERAKKILRDRAQSTTEQSSDSFNSTLEQLRVLESASSSLVASPKHTTSTGIAAAASPADSSKPSWSHLITPGVTVALEKFKAEAEAAGAGQLDRLSAIPRQLEPALVALDTAVKSEITAGELRKHSGYYEDVAKLMGGK